MSPPLADQYLVWAREHRGPLYSGRSTLSSGSPMLQQSLPFIGAWCCTFSPFLVLQRLHPTTLIRRYVLAAVGDDARVEGYSCLWVRSY